MHPPLRILSAGSLREALTAHVAAREGSFELVFGPAGLLRERIEQGEACDLFLSASMEHPVRLAGKIGGSATLFARNPFMAVARKEVGLRPDNFLDLLLDASVRIGTSTPKADPSGDYAFALFDRAEKLRAGAAAILQAKAMQLVGGREPARIPEGRNPATYFLVDGIVDMFLGYRSGARHQAAAFDVVLPPPELQITAEYGLLVTAGAAERKEAASAFAASLLDAAGQAGLAAHGFEKLG